MTISLLFSTLIFSVIIFEKGLNGFPLDIINTFGFIVAYSIPIFVLEILVRKLLEKQADSKKIYLGIFLRSLSVAFLSAFLWVIAVGLLLRPQGEEGMIFIVTPIVYVIFFVLNFVLSVIILWSERKRKNRSFKNASIIVLSISFILLIYGGWALAKCGGAGCGNEEYLVERAVKENNPSICKLAGRTEDSSSPVSLLALSDFYATTISDCYSSLAIKSNNVELCKSAGYKSGYCYRIFAENLIDPSLCDKIADGEYQKETCLDSLAQKTKNINICDKIVDSNVREGCKSRIKQ